MRRKSNTQYHKLNHEFDLDLAPLLAVMVKLVPVLLVSSAFVQVMMIETELPQVVKEAIQKDENESQERLQLNINSENGIQILFQDKENQEKSEIPLNQDKSYNFQALHEKLVEFKSMHPKLFKLELNPDNQVSYENIVKIMDEARKSRPTEKSFPVYDSKQDKEIETNYMFPNIVFSNVIEG